MKRTLLVIAVQSILLATPFAQETHLAITVPDRVASGFFGPVKKVIMEYSYNMSDRKYKEIRLYDKAGNLTSKTKWNTKEEITHFVTNTFDEAGCFVNQRVEDLREAITNDYKIVLNFPSRKIAYCDQITGELEVQEHNEAKYFISATIKKKGKSTLPLSSYKRGPDNQKQLYTRYNEKGRVKYTTAFKWNEQQLKSRTLTTNREKNSKSLYIYEYLAIDRHGNWTQCLMQCLDMKKNKEKKFEKISKRTIEYFDDTPAEPAP